MTSPLHEGHRAHEVLVVDDNDDVREAFVSLLVVHGHRATPAESGDAALRQMHEGLRPCVVLLDIRMPGMDGWTVWERMRTDPELASIPIVMVTGEVREWQRAEARGIRHFLRKPAEPQALLAAVEEHCRS